MTAARRITFSPEIREFAFARDGYRCQSCGQLATAKTLELDHIEPLSQGGTNDLSNLQTLCRRCNRRKADRRDPRFQRRYRARDR